MVRGDKGKCSEPSYTVNTTYTSATDHPLEAAMALHLPSNGTLPLEMTSEQPQPHSGLPSGTIALLVALLMTIPLLLSLRSEYRSFISLGPGGTPQTLAGFLRIYLLSFVKVTDPYKMPRSYAKTAQTTGFLGKVPQREGPRPETRGIAPHRQVTQQSNDTAYELLVAAIEHLSSSSPNLYIGTSCFEKHSSGLFALHPVNRTCGGEVCHTHPSDGGSLHLTLHPADVKTVLERGWGERHPLSRGGWFERFVPAGFVMVYAPRDPREVEIVAEVVRAAVWFVCCGEVVKSSCDAERA